ncbi:MAG: lysine--tRNA ligase [Pseudomonadota bacterium]|nr:lysine--tRNA ligase [Pseudomonadota bacterium]
MSQENPLRAEKRKKLDALRAAKINPYPYSFERTHRVSEIIELYETKLSAEEKVEGAKVRMAGRLMTKRPMGKAAFFNFQDQTGNLQVYLKLDELNGPDAIVFDNIDIGDFIGIEGIVFKTKKGELSIRAGHIEMLCKTLEPLPEKYHGLTDIEAKYRYRHLDLIMDSASRKVFETRSLIIREFRRFLDDKGFLEVETPVLQPIYGGAAAHPFSTHHRALDMKLFLKISPELYLKKLVVGGFEKVYEIGKNFRNEGIDRTHNPEFCMLEWYEAYTDYNYQQKQFEEIIATVVKKIKGSTKINYQGKEIDFTTPWKRLTVYGAIKEFAGIEVENLSVAELFKVCKEFGSELEKPLTHGEMVMELFDLKVEDKIWHPTIIKDFPKEISPLTKVHRENPRLVERFEPICAGMELGNAYSELNDPEDQLARLQEQEAKRLVDEEAQPMDENFMHAIDVGMPPSGGVGIGIERIIMLITDCPSIRDIILFPTMKKEH